MFALASCAAAKRDGKERLASGAWTISKDYIRNAGDCSDPSDPPSLRWSAGQCSYKLDRKLARCLATFFSGRSVTELGAGAGRYKAFVRAAGNVTAYAAYDGLPNAAELSGGLVETADLSVDQPSLRRSDWAMSLEVFEHIPRRFEDAVRRNVDRAAGDGIVISWSVMGGSQSEHGHVNPKRKTQVRQFLAPIGMVEDRTASASLRRCTTFLYLRRGIQVFRRNTTLGERAVRSDGTVT